MPISSLIQDLFHASLSLIQGLFVLPFLNLFQAFKDLGPFLLKKKLLRVRSKISNPNYQVLRKLIFELLESGHLSLIFTCCKRCRYSFHALNWVFGSGESWHRMWCCLTTSSTLRLQVPETAYFSRKTHHSFGTSLQIRLPQQDVQTGKG